MKQTTLLFTNRKGSALLAAALTIIALLTACGTEESIESLKKKAQAGNAEAQFNLGLMYSTGIGVPENDVEAVKWYRRAAEQGHAESQFELGEMYYYGRDVPHSYVEAAKWYRRAAE